MNVYVARQPIFDKQEKIYAYELLFRAGLENVEPDREIMEACHELKQKGYQLALDDFVLADKYRPLVEIADIIKVDFLATPMEKCRDLITQVQQMCREPKIYLAEKVENRDVFEKSKAIGYMLFQGYFFSRPARKRSS